MSFLFIPEELHAKARAFFANAESEGIGPNYPCPYLDPTWGIEHIQKALDDLPAPLATDAVEDHHGYVYEHVEADGDPDNCTYRMVVTGQCVACGHFHGEQCLVCGGYHGL